MYPEQIYILLPYDPKEAISVSQAAKKANKSVGTIRLWCEMHKIGRRVAGGNWQVSAVALSMLVDGDEVALRSYLAGDRTSEHVAPYFRRHGLTPVPAREG